MESRIAHKHAHPSIVGLSGHHFVLSSPSQCVRKVHAALHCWNIKPPLLQRATACDCGRSAVRKRTKKKGKLWNVVGK